MKQIHWHKYDGGVWTWRDWTIVMRHCHGRPTYWIKNMHDFVWPAATLAKAKEWVKNHLTSDDPDLENFSVPVSAPESEHISLKAEAKNALMRSASALL